jgi:ribonuclease HI
MSFVYIYADESCLGNQYMDRDSPGGAAGVVQTWRGGRWVRRDYWVAEPATTNNRMALRSAIEPLARLKTPCQVIFVSDSQYLVKGMTEWVGGWVRRAWKRSGGALENMSLWQTLVEVDARHQIEWRWLRGHAGHVLNEYANWRAIRAAKEQTQSDGLIPSAFDDWLERERAKGRYRDYEENAPPPPEVFHPARKPQSATP